MPSSSASLLNSRVNDRKPPGSISGDEVLLILNKWGTLKNCKYSTLARDTSASGVGLRVDLGRGITKSADVCLSQILKFNRDFVVLFPPVSSGDIGYACEGEFILSNESLMVLKELAKHKLVTFGFLADPGACISFIMNNVFTVWTHARERFHMNGIDIQGYGCSFHKSTTSMSNLYWSYRTSGLLENTNWLEINSALNFEGREWVFDVPPAGVFTGPLDGISRLSMSASGSKSARFLKSHLTHASMTFQRKCKLSFDFIAYTDGGGWGIVFSDGEEVQITTDELDSMLSKSSRKGRIGIVVDPNDVDWSSFDSQLFSNGLKDGSLRRLPYPFDYYLSVSSDVDWSNYSQLTHASDYMSLEAGLPTSFSAYPISRDSRWPSYDEILRGIQSESLAWNRMPAVMHTLDTFHGIINSFDDLHLVGIGNTFLDQDKVFSVFGYKLFNYDGFVMVVNRRGFSTEGLPKIQLMGEGGFVKTLAASEFFHPKSQDVVLLYFEISPGDEFADLMVSAIRVLNPSQLEVLELHTTSYIRRKVGKLLENLPRYNFNVPIFTGHGGGEGVWDFGALNTRRWLDSHPEHARMALDLPGTPYYILDILKSHGVYFFNPNDILSCNDLFDIDDLLKVTAAQDDSSIYVFSRFYSQRSDDTGRLPSFSYGKHGATAQGFPFTLNDILQRLHWSPPGRGCIIYTHLGHRVGNQVSARLGWNEELLASLARLSEYVYARDADEPVPFRIWFAPASSILTFSLLMKHLPQNIARIGDRITISSWRDEVLGEMIPAPEMFGTSWLHGLTFYVDDPDQAQVFVDNCRIEHYTCNYPDGFEPPSISLVDSSRKRQVVPGNFGLLSVIKYHRTSQMEIHDHSNDVTIVAPKPGDGSQEGENCVWELCVPPVSLRNATHWTFEAFLFDGDLRWSFGFQTPDLQWFDFGTFPGSAWKAGVANTSSEWKRFTLAFADSQGAYIPREAVIALRIKLPNLGDAGMIKLRDVSIIYPAPTMKLSTNRRILSGSVTRFSDGNPISGIGVNCLLNNEIRKSVTDSAGRYIFDDLPDNARCKIDVQLDHSAVRFMSGDVAHLSCDLWDWDIEVY